MIILKKFIRNLTIKFNETIESIKKLGISVTEKSISFDLLNAINNNTTTPTIKILKLTLLFLLLFKE